jgi:hypothetical protein
MVYNPFFDYQKERNGMKAGARHRKVGSKTKYVSLPSDHMTAAEWKRRNGQINTYDMGKPMEWKVYKRLPEDMKKQYIAHLLDTYGLTSSQLADMFGVSGVTATGECARLGLKYKLPGRGNRWAQSDDQREAWDEWRRGEATESVTPAPELGIEAEPQTSAAELEPPHEELPPMVVHSWETSLHGAFNPESVLQVLAALVQPGELVSEKIRVVK